MANATEQEPLSGVPSHISYSHNTNVKLILVVTAMVLLITLGIVLLILFYLSGTQNHQVLFSRPDGCRYSAKELVQLSMASIEVKFVVTR